MTDNQKSKIRNPKFAKIAFYLRVSTQPQEFASQLHALREFCRRSGWNVPKRNLVFAEKVTGKKARRTHLDALLNACRAGHVDTVITYRADRLGNSAAHMHNLLEEFAALKIRVIGVADSIDTAQDSATLRMFRSIVLAFAQGQRETTVERTIAGMKAARASGKDITRPRTKDAAITRALKIYAKGGVGLRTVAKQCGISFSYLSLIVRGLRPKT